MKRVWAQQLASGLFALLTPGLGLFWLGRQIMAAVFFMGFVVLYVASRFFDPVGFLILQVGLFVWFAASIIVTMVHARNRRPIWWIGNPLLLNGLCVGMLVLTQLVLGPLVVEFTNRNGRTGAFIMPTSSNEPALCPGDGFLVTWNRASKKNQDTHVS